jgi:hypothetical protein
VIDIAVLGLEPGTQLDPRVKPEGGKSNVWARRALNPRPPLHPLMRLLIGMGRA